jgi:16S rRNA (cytidine1402-2'-O)-methyltransferase
MDNGRVDRGTLYVVATPIGNLSDASPRSVEVLRSVDLVACEDTRTTRTLLGHYGIAARTVALHEHNERAAAKGLIAALRDGKSVALVSDAGTPGIADPGALLVAEAHRAGLRVSPVPGPSAAAAAFSAAGFAAPGYRFAGFLPASAARGARRSRRSTVPCRSSCSRRRIASPGPWRPGGEARPGADHLARSFQEFGKSRTTLGEASW